MKLKDVNIATILGLLFLVGLGIAPFIFAPRSVLPFEIPKVYFLRYWILGLILIGLLSFRRLNLFPLALPITLSWLFLALVFLASLLGADLTRSLEGNFYRRDGLYTFIYLAAFASWLSYFYRSSWQRPLLLVLAGTGITLSGFSLIGGSLYGLAGPFGQPVFLAGYLAVVLPAVIYLGETAKGLNKYLWFIGVILLLLVIWLAQAWGAMLAVAGYGLFRLGLKPGWQRLLALGLAGIALVYLLVNYLQWDKARENYYESRERLIRTSLISFSQRPLFGWGWANFDQAFSANAWPRRYTPDIYADKAHSHLLEILVTAGSIGVIAYSVLVLAVIQRLRRPQVEPVFLFMLMVFLLHSQTNIISISEELLFWLTVGIAASSYRFSCR